LVGKTVEGTTVEDGIVDVAFATTDVGTVVTGVGVTLQTIELGFIVEFKVVVALLNQLLLGCTVDSTEVLVVMLKDVEVGCIVRWCSDEDNISVEVHEGEMDVDWLKYSEEEDTIEE
jgi:hypothetical protein